MSESERSEHLPGSPERAPVLEYLASHLPFMEPNHVNITVKVHLSAPAKTLGWAIDLCDAVTGEMFACSVSPPRPQAEWPTIEATLHEALRYAVERHAEPFPGPRRPDAVEVPRRSS